MHTLKLLLLLAAGALLAAVLPTPVIAAPNADLEVKGKIIPTSCNLSFNKSEISLGIIPASSLNQGASTKLPDDRSASLTVTCDAPTRFALTMIDHRADSTLPPNDTDTFGLGKTPAGENIGQYSGFIDTVSSTAAGELRTLTSLPDGSSWGGGNFFDTTRIFGFSKPSDNDSTGPIALNQVTGTLVIQPRIARADSLTLTSAVPIDGSMSMELKYL